MSKIIIHNNSSASDLLALICVQQVIADGRISNEGKQYCYATLFKSLKVAVTTRLNKSSDVFYVTDHEE